LALLAEVVEVAEVVVRQQKTLTAGVVAVAAVVNRGLIIHQAALLAIPIFKDLEQLPPDQVVHRLGPVREVLEALHQTLKRQAGSVEPEELGDLLDQLGHQVLGLAALPLVALEVLLVLLLLVIQTLYGLHLELVWVQSLER
jgi:hypothetical protein